jgi:hypothetical protein
MIKKKPVRAASVLQCSKSHDSSGRSDSLGEAVFFFRRHVIACEFAARVSSRSSCKFKKMFFLRYRTCSRKVPVSGQLV